MTYAKEHINVDDSASMGLSEPIGRPAIQSPGELFSHLQQKYGRCTGKVRIDRPGEEGVPVGWVFERRRSYSDSEGTFLEETWVLVLSEGKGGYTQTDIRSL